MYTEGSGKMKKTIVKAIKKYGITIWLAVAAVSVGALAVRAAYTSTKQVKNVVSTNPGVGALFSSNYLTSGTVPSFRRISFDSLEYDPKVYVDICNYSQEDPTKYYDGAINYVLTAELVNKDGNNLSSYDTSSQWYKKYSVAYNSETQITFGSDCKIVFDIKQLPMGEPVSDRFIITYDKLQLSSPDEPVYVKITADPLIKKDEIDILSGILGVSAKTADDNASNWTGNFTDQFVDNVSVSSKEFDAFNYNVSGSGTGVFTLEWNTEYVNISRWFIDELTKAGNIINSESGKVEFTVNSSLKNQYSLQFYRTRKPADGEIYNENRKVADGDTEYVSCSFTPA